MPGAIIGGFKKMTDKYFYGWTRITKARARKEYNAGRDVLFIPVKMPVRRDYYCNHVILNNHGPRFSKNDSNFDTLCNHFEYYNCNNETGKYTAFYIWRN